jgi:hypothetical protein
MIVIVVLLGRFAKRTAVLGPPRPRHTDAMQEQFANPVTDGPLPSDLLLSSKASNVQKVVSLHQNSNLT